MKCRAKCDAQLTRLKTNGLDTLVCSFPREKRIVFNSNRRQAMPLDLGACSPTDKCIGEPSIIACLPCYPILPVTTGATWWDISIVVDVDAAATDDPITEFRGNHVPTLTRIERSVNCIMVAQGRLFAFAVGVYGHTARIYRFDRAGIMVSPAFEYAKQPDILHEFLWRFLNPTQGGSSVIGSDPTIRAPTDAEYRWATLLARQHEDDAQQGRQIIEQQHACRLFSVTGRQGHASQYLGYRVVSTFIGHAFSRGVTVWKALDMSTGDRVVVKDLWRPMPRPSEIRFYEDIQAYSEWCMEEEEACDDADVQPQPGLAQFLCGEDLGGVEQRNRLPGARATQTGIAVLSSLHHQSLGPATGHQTVSARLLGKDDWREHEKSHERFVVESVGTPLAKFGPTKELVEAIRDALLGTCLRPISPAPPANSTGHPRPQACIRCRRAPLRRERGKRSPLPAPVCWLQGIPTRPRHRLRVETVPGVSRVGSRRGEL